VVPNLYQKPTLKNRDPPFFRFGAFLFVVVPHGLTPARPKNTLVTLSFSKIFMRIKHPTPPQFALDVNRLKKVSSKRTV
jgi:hypothetical protein